MNRLEIEMATTEKVHETVRALRTYHTSLRMGAPTIRLYDKRAGVAGFANSSTVNFNWFYLEPHFDDYLARTVPHEVAHWADFQIRFRSGHDRPWKDIMNFLGLDATRCHSYDMKEIRPYLYECPRCSQGFYLSKRAHNSTLRGGLRYHVECGARKAGAALRFIQMIKT